MSQKTLQFAGLALGISKASVSMAFDNVSLPSLPGAVCPA